MPDEDTPSTAELMRRSRISDKNEYPASLAERIGGGFTPKQRERIETARREAFSPGTADFRDIEEYYARVEQRPNVRMTGPAQKL